MTESAVRGAPRALALLLVLVPLLPACRHAPAAAATAGAGPDAGPPPLLQLGREVRPLAYRLALDVDPSSERFTGTVEIDVVLDRPRQVIWLHGKELAVTSASAAPPGGGGVAARYEQVNDEGLARLTLAAPLPPGPAVLRLAWSAAFGTLVGLAVSRDATERYAATQFEAIDARRCFPGFDDPAFKTPFEVTLTVPEGLVAVSNAPEASRAAAGPGRRAVRFAPTAPLPTYLVFVGVGPFDVVETTLPPTAIRPRPLAVRALGPRGQARELDWPLAMANRLLLDLEGWFGTPFPFPKLDHVVVPHHFSAMENAGAIAYGAGLFLAPAGVGETRRHDIAETIAHEQAHQWFGDLVTLPWWTEIWLNESFAEWMGIRATARVEPAWRHDLQLPRSAGWAMETDGLPSSQPIRQPLVRMAGVMGQFDGLRYGKGAAVLHMLERWLGEAAFRDGVRAYLAAHAHGTGSTEALLAALSGASGRDVAAVAGPFLDQAGVPLVEARPTCDARGARVALRQSRWRPKGGAPVAEAAWQVPVCLRYQAGGAVHERCALLTGSEAEVALPEGCPAWLLPNAGGAGYYRWTLPPEALAALLASGLPHLTVAEKVSLAQSVEAAQKAGALTYAAALDALAGLAADPDAAVAELPVTFLRESRESLVPDAAVADVDEVIDRLYRARLARLGWSPLDGEPPDDDALRRRLLTLFTFHVPDQPLRDEAARRGARFLGAETGRLEPDGLGLDLVPAAVGALLRRDGARAAELLLARWDEASPAVRVALSAALLWAEGPTTALWREMRFGPTERFAPLRRLAWRRATREPLLALLERDLDALLEAQADGEDVFFPSLLAGLCSAGEVARARALFEPRLAARPGMTKVLEEALAEAGQCATRREADGAAAGEAFRALAARLRSGGGALR